MGFNDKIGDSYKTEKTPSEGEKTKGKELNISSENIRKLEQIKEQMECDIVKNTIIKMNKLLKKGDNKGAENLIIDCAKKLKCGIN